LGNNATTSKNKNLLKGKGVHQNPLGSEATIQGVWMEGMAGMPNFVGEVEDKHCKIAYYLFRLRECPPKLLFPKSQNAFPLQKNARALFHVH